MAYPFQMGIPDATSPITEELLHFHVHTLMMMFLISSLVLYMLLPCSLYHFINTNY